MKHLLKKDRSPSGIFRKISRVALKKHGCDGTVVHTSGKKEEIRITAKRLTAG